MFIKNFIALSMLLSFNLIGDESSEQSFPGLVSTEVFNMGNGMEMHIERRKHVIKELYQNIFILLQAH